MHYIITDQNLFDSLNVHVDIVGDNVEVNYKRNGKRHTTEQWGHFGKEDFKDFGFEIHYGPKESVS